MKYREELSKAPIRKELTANKAPHKGSEIWLGLAVNQIVCKSAIFKVLCHDVRWASVKEIYVSMHRR